MRRIIKGAPPPELAKWIPTNPGKRYQYLDSDVSQAIRRATLAEQHCLCAYCCNLIDGETCHNEHVEAQDIAPNRTVDFTNIVASCNTRNQCGKAHKNQPLPLTPLNPACETDLTFYLTGKVAGSNQNAIEAIRVLNLDNPALRQQRKTIVDALIYEDPTGLQLLDDDLLKEILADIQQADAAGCLQPFSPILANIIRSFLAA